MKGNQVPRGWSRIESDDDDECKVLCIEVQDNGLFIASVSFSGTRESTECYAAAANKSLSPNARQFIRYSVFG